MSDLVRNVSFFEYGFAAYAALYLILEAEVWGQLAAMLRRKITPVAYVKAMYACAICLGFVVTAIPVLFATWHPYLSPIRWLAVNGVLIALSAFVPIMRRDEEAA